MKLAAALALCLAWNAQAQSPLPALYGIQLGQPLNLPECERRVFLGKWQYDSINTKAGPCYHQGYFYDVKPDAPIDNAPVGVMWPTLQGGPEIAKSKSIGVRLVDGVVHRISIDTRGLAVQETTFDQLVQKFGKPRSSKTVPLQNRLGAKFDAIYAEWRDGDVMVSFAGMLGTVDTGIVIVETQRGHDAEKAAMEKLLGTKPKM